MAQAKKQKTKMGQWTFSEQELDQQFAEANRRGKEALQTKPRAKSVSYDRANRRILIDMLDGTLLGIPINYMQGLLDAPTDEIETVQLSPLGDSLRWENLDLEFSVAGLAANRFGSKAWMVELGRKGGLVQSQAKAAAARDNGRKGGRPRKEHPIVWSIIVDPAQIRADLEWFFDDPFVFQTSQITQSDLAVYDRSLTHLQSPFVSGSIEYKGGMSTIVVGTNLATASFVQGDVASLGKTDSAVDWKVDIKEAEDNADLALAA